ncbi:MAG: hypothetical protein RIR31_167 [Bacteroidota bacterium]|jgi:hypothetical protein
MKINYSKYFLAIFFLISSINFNVGCKKSKDASPQKDIVTKKKLDSYTEVQYGNMPLIISVPHGGTDDPTFIPDRTCPGITTAIDIKTIEMVNAIDSICKAEYGFQPYLVISYLKRIKLDQNRDLPEATCSNSAITNIWNNYHLSIDSFITKINAKYPLALFIDLHGHGHTKERLELGYLLSGSELRNPTAINPVPTSIFNLLQQNTSLQINLLLTGTNAFGTLMANNNFPSVPSQQDAAPLVTDLYFDGGYNTQRYCSVAYPKVFGWQIETNYMDVRNNQTSRVNFAKAFLQSIMQFYKRNTFIDPTNFGQ